MSRLHVLQQCQPTLPAFSTRLGVGRIGVAGIFTCAHEAVASAFIGDRIIFLSGLLHSFLSIRYGGVNASIVASIETVNRSSDRRHVLGRGTVEDKRGLQVFAIGGKTE